MLTASACTCGKLLAIPTRILDSSPNVALLRANRAQYSEVSFGSIVEDDVLDVSLPSMQGVAEDEGKMDVPLGENFELTITLALEALSALTVQDQPADVFITPPQLDGDLVTLTLLPRSRWQTLLNLEVIQVRHLHALAVSVPCTETRHDCSNVTSPRSHRSSLRRPLSSCLRCLGSSSVSRSSRRRQRRRSKRIRTGSSARQGPPKASSSPSYLRRIRASRPTVSPAPPHPSESQQN